MSFGIKTAMTARESEELQRLATGRTVFEVGSLLGHSTILMATTAKRVFAIDPHDGYPHYNPAPTLFEFLRNIERWGVAGVVTPVVDKAQNVLPHLCDGDMTFIDCTGLYNDTRFCLEQAKTPVIACHDFMRAGCEGVTRAVEEFTRETGRLLRTVDTLAIIE